MGNWRIMNPMNPQVFHDRAFVKDGLKQPFLVVRNALRPEIAEELYGDLMQAENWGRQAVAEPGFIYERHNIAMESTQAPASLTRIYGFLSSPECLEWISEVSERKCDSFQGAAAMFRPGDRISEHTDRMVFTKPNGDKIIRMVTFTYYLTKNWDAKWGGRFIWKTPYSEIVPEFNTLVLFNVSSNSHHWVEPIAEGVTEKRLSMTGWFLNSQTNQDVLKKKLNLKI